MAITVTRYKSNDGAMWHLETDADDRNDLLANIAAVNSLLEPPPKGDGFTQQKAASVMRYKRALVKLAKKHVPSDIWSRELSEIYPRGVAGRILDDCCEPLAQAWYRLMSMDKKYRECNQPYYAMEADGASE